MFAKDAQPEAKSLAEIVREVTHDGRVIARAMLEIMGNKDGDAEPCLRLEATGQLLDLGCRQRLADFIRENTDDGRVIVRFLMGVFKLKIDGVSPRDRRYARQLLKRIFNGETLIALPVPPKG